MQLIDVQITPELKGVLAVPDAGTPNPADVAKAAGGSASGAATSAGQVASGQVVSGQRPSVVMVHEVFGIDDAMRAQIERLANAGYVVLMPDLFSRGGIRKCLNATFKALSSGEGQAFEDVEAAKQFLLERPDTTDKIGVIGFCMGGGFALLLANRGYDASAVNYGMMPKDLDAVLGGACPIVGSFGGRDGQLKGAAAKLEVALSAKGIAHDIKEYPESGHAFMNPKQAGGPVFGTLLRISGAKPNPVDAADAWQRIETFFGKHLTV